MYTPVRFSILLILLIHICTLSESKAQESVILYGGWNLKQVESGWEYRRGPTASHSCYCSHITVQGAEMGLEYSPTPKNWSVLAQVSYNWTLNNYRGWAFISGLNLTVGESKKGLSIGPRIGARHDSYIGDWASLFGGGASLNIYLNEQIVLNGYADIFYERYFPADYALSLGVRVGLRL